MRTLEEKAEIARLYLEGHVYGDLMKQFHMDGRMLKRILLAQGVKFRPQKALRPVVPVQVIRDVKERFLEHVVKSQDANGCWTWIGALQPSGYGYFKIGKGKDRRLTGAHRASMILFKGIVPQNLVCHTCDNKLCVNPDHLFEGTHFDNAQDSIKKGRMPRGVQISSAKLDEAKVVEIREAAKKNESHASIASRYGVCRATVGSVVHRETWNHVS